jgi:hypothetical protein
MCWNSGVPAAYKLRDLHSLDAGGDEDRVE